MVHTLVFFFERGGISGIFFVFWQGSHFRMLFFYPSLSPIFLLAQILGREDVGKAKQGDLLARGEKRAKELAPIVNQPRIPAKEESGPPFPNLPHTHFPGRRVLPALLRAASVPSVAPPLSTTMEWLKSVHFYRKVPRDLTEATLAGGTISLLSSIVMAYLFISNFSAPVLSEAGPAWPASAARARLARARLARVGRGWPKLGASLGRGLALRGASGEAAGRSLSQLVFDAGVPERRAEDEHRAGCVSGEEAAAQLQRDALPPAVPLRHARHRRRDGHALSERLDQHH